MHAYMVTKPFQNSDLLGPRLDFAEENAVLPGIRCDASIGGCGKVWADGSRRLYVPLPENHFLLRESPWPLPPQDWQDKWQQVRQSLNLPDMQIEPGTAIGYTRLEVRQKWEIDIEWPYLSTVIISQKVVDALQNAGITGWRKEPVVITGGRYAAVAPPLFELVVEGRGGKARTEPETRLLSVCPVCGRKKFDRGKLNANSLDLDQWDKSDFFRFDAPEHGIYYCTEKVKSLFEANNFKYVVFPEIGYVHKFNVSPPIRYASSTSPTGWLEWRGEASGQRLPYPDAEDLPGDLPSSDSVSSNDQ